jgi:hypothetical protein
VRKEGKLEHEDERSNRGGDDPHVVVQPGRLDPLARTEPCGPQVADPLVHDRGSDNNWRVFHLSSLLGVWLERV